MSVLEIEVMRHCRSNVTMATTCVGHDFGSYTNISVMVKKNRSKYSVTVDSQSYFHDENQWEEYHKKAEFFCRLNRPSGKKLAIQTILENFDFYDVLVCVKDLQWDMPRYKKQNEEEALFNDEEVPF